MKKFFVLLSSLFILIVFAGHSSSSTEAATAGPPAGGFLRIHRIDLLNPAIESELALEGPGQVRVQAVAVDQEGNLIIAGDTRGGALDIAPSEEPIGIGGLVRFRRDTQTWETIPSNLDTLQVTLLVIDPQDSDILYAGTQELGILKSSDGGQTWNVTNAGLEKSGSGGQDDFYPTVYAVTVNPEDSNEVLLILQTKGLYQSIDGGTNWTLLNDSHRLNNMNQLIISRKDPKILFAGGSSTFLRSEDGGQSWEDADESPFFQCITQLDDGTLLICQNDSILKSTDIGATWERIFRGSSVAAIQLAVHPQNPQTMAVVEFNPLSPKNPQIRLSRDGGTTWVVGPILPRRGGFQVAFDPLSENDLLLISDIGASIISEGEPAIQELNQGLPSTKLCCHAISGSSDLYAVAQDDWDSFVLKLTPDAQEVLYAAYFGGDSDDNLKALAVQPDGRVFAAGTTVSPDFPVLKPYEETLRNGQAAYLVSLTPDGEIRNATYYNSQAAGTLEAEDLVVDSQGRAILMGTNFFSDVDRSSRLFVVRFTSDGQDLSFERLIGGDDNIRGVSTYGRAITLDEGENIYLAGDSNSKFIPLVRPFQNQFSKDRTSTVFGGDGVLVRLEESTGEISWSTYLGGNGPDTVADIAFSPGGNLVVAGTTDSGNLPGAEHGAQPQQSGGLFVLQGETWLARNANLPLPDIQSIAINPDNPDQIAISVRGYGVYSSQDGGETWQPSTLFEEGLRDIVLHAAGPWMAAADDQTIYLSDDGGQTWEATSFNNPNLATPDFVYLISEDPLQIFAGVRGAGITRSVDGGQTWQEASFTDRKPFKIIQIEASVDNPEFLTATDGTNGYRSIDGGITWDLMAEPQTVRSFTYDPHHPGSIYALSSFDIYHSIDDGETWEEVQDKSRSETKLLIDPDEPGLFYLIDTSGEVRRSLDEGQTWELLAEIHGLYDFHLSTDRASTGFGLVEISPDGFVSLVDLDANLVSWTTYLGGTSRDEISSIEIDSQGDIYVAGNSAGHFPLVNPWAAETGGGLDGFLAKVSGTGDEIIYSTFLGKENSDAVEDIALVSEGKIIAAGSQWQEDRLGYSVIGYADQVLDIAPTPQATATPPPSPTPTTAPPSPEPTENSGPSAAATPTSTEAPPSADQEPPANPANCLGGMLPLIFVGAFLFYRSNRTKERRGR